MIVTTKRLNALYKAMIKEAKGPATMNYLLALMSRNDELRLENEMLRDEPLKGTKVELDPNLYKGEDAP